MNPSKNLILPDFARYFFALFVVGILLLFAWIISPFFNVLIYAATIVVIFYPLYKWMRTLLPRHHNIAAFLSTLFVMIVVLTPLAFFILFLSQEALNAYQLLSSTWITWDVLNLRFDGLSEIPVLGAFFQPLAERFSASDFVYSMVTLLKDLTQSVAGFLVAQSTSILATVRDTVLGFFILLLTVFFFFRDGERFLEILRTLSPLPDRYESEIGNKLRDTTYAIVMGSFVTAMMQGIVGGIGLAIAGVHNVVFWSTLMAFAALLIPYVGSSLIWGPIALVTLLQGDIFWGVFILLWGVCLVSLVDNVARPLLIGSRTRTHALTTFLAVLGGILVFGIKGIIFGPLILSLTITILHIYQLEYRDMLHDE
ncbi:AI-2E family transporter [Candidatus Peregrinibacteria bacterium]|nr:MAG: AI-2E family transporter [Candidatus Peregrinibacteria bacterium]